MLAFTSFGMLILKDKNGQLPVYICNMSLTSLICKSNLVCTSVAHVGTVSICIFPSMLILQLLKFAPEFQPDHYSTQNQLEGTWAAASNVAIVGAIRVESSLFQLLTSKHFKAMHTIQGCSMGPSFCTSSISLVTTALLWYLSEALSRIPKTKLNMELVSWHTNANLKDIWYWKLWKIMNSFLILGSRFANCSLGYFLE